MVDVAVHGKVQPGAGVVADLAVHQQAMMGLEPLHRAQGDGTELAVGRHPESALERGHGRAAVVQPQHDLAGAAALLRGQRRASVWADLAVDQQPVRGLKLLHRAQGDVAEHAVRRDAQHALDANEVRPRVSQPQDARMHTARPGSRRRLVLLARGVRGRPQPRRGRSHHERHAHPACPPSSTVRLASAKRARRRRFPEVG